MTMITIAVTCPPAPFLIPGLAPTLLHSGHQVHEAALAAVGALSVATDIVILSSTSQSEATTVPAGTPIGDAGLSRSDFPTVTPVALPGAHHASAGDAPKVSTGTAVAAHLLAQAGITAPTSAYQVVDGAALTLPAGPVGLLVMADGCASHGPDAPGAEDERAADFDAELMATLAIGDPQQLADFTASQADLAQELRAQTWPVWQAFAATAAAAGTANVEVRHYSTPFGVGYPVTVWRWDATGPNHTGNTV